MYVCITDEANISSFPKKHRAGRISGRNDVSSDIRKGITPSKYKRLSFVISYHGRLVLFRLTAVSALPPRYSQRLGLRISGPDGSSATRHTEVVARALPQDGIGNNS